MIRSDLFCYIRYLKGLILDLVELNYRVCKLISMVFNLKLLDEIVVCDNLNESYWIVCLYDSIFCILYFFSYVFMKIISDVGE